MDALISKYKHKFACQMENLYIKPGLKGLVYGKMDLILNQSQLLSLEGKSLIPDMTEINDVSHTIKTVLVIEKDTVFSKVEDPSLIIVCGKGYPCSNTLKLLKLLERKSNIFCLTDFDPYGLHIFTIYKKYIRSIRRIGLCSDDLFRHKVTVQQCIELNKYDLKMIERLKNTEVKDDAMFIEGLGMKIELEMLLNRTDFNILDYLSVNKIVCH